MAKKQNLGKKNTFGWRDIISIILPKT